MLSFAFHPLVCADGACGPQACPPPGCFNAPKTLSVAIADQPDPVPPALQSVCPDPPANPCRSASPPLLDTAFPVGPNEITVKAALPAGVCPHEVQWKAESLMDDGITWQTRYEHVSLDSVAQQFLENGVYHVRFGAPGLDAGRTHRFSVAYCCDQITPPEIAGCTCWSSPSVSIQTTQYRAGQDLPQIPLDGNGTPIFQQEFSDGFRRPETTSKRSAATGTWLGGDGLGPATVWTDDNALSGIGNGSHIDGDSSGQWAVLPANAIAEYATLPARPDVFLETLVELGSNSSDNFNFDLRTRQHVDQGEVYWYIFKVAKGLQNAGSVPDLVLGVHPCPSSLPAGWTCHGTWAEIARVDIGALDCDGDGTAGDDIPDLRSNGQGEKVWIGMQAVDEQITQSVDLTGYLAWGTCDAGTDLMGCTNACTVVASDSSDQAQENMLGVPGTVGFDAHEQQYLMYVFRGGSKP